MPAGTLDRRIIIEAPTKASDSFGESIVTWSQFLVVWAAYNVSGGVEQFNANQRTNERRVTFDIRYAPDITNQMRVIYDGEEFPIESITELGRRDMLRLVCTSREVKTGPSGA